MSEGLTCRELIEFLDDFVAGALAPERAARFEGHLRECAACADYVKTYRDTIALSRAAEGPTSAAPMPPALVAAILRARAGARGGGAGA